jgi:hypothetical protein
MACSTSAIASVARQELQVPADDLAGAALDGGRQVAPAVLGRPDGSEVQVPQLVGRVTRKNRGRQRRSTRRPRWSSRRSGITRSS